MSKIIVLENMIGFIGLIFAVFSNDTLDKLYHSFTGRHLPASKPIGEMSTTEKWARRLLWIFGAYIFIHYSVLPVFIDIMPHQDPLTEQRIFDDAKICIQMSCNPKPNACIEHFEHDFPLSDDLNILQEQYIENHSVPDFCKKDSRSKDDNGSHKENDGSEDSSKQPIQTSKDITRANGLAELQRQAFLWIDRTSSQYSDFRLILHEFRDDQNLSQEGRDALDILLGAEGVLNWRSKGWNRYVWVVWSAGHSGPTTFGWLSAGESILLAANYCWSG